VLLEYGVHLVDMVRTLLGEPTSVSARMERINRRVRAESLAHVVFELPQATAIIDIAWKAHGLNQGGALFIGDKGEAFFEGRMTRGESARFRVVQGDMIVLDETRCPTDDYVEAFYLFERAFVDAVLGRCGPPQPMPHNLKTLEATFAAYSAAESRRPVSLAEFAESR
jgi:predicted dehydrogenase